SAIATIIGMRLFGEPGILVATITLTIVVLIFAEVTPKTLAALHPERFALPAALILQPMLKLLYPVVWLVNLATRGIFKILRVPLTKSTGDTLSREELRIVVNEAGSMIPQQHQKMLLSILDLEKATVEDIMIPRNEIAGVDLNDDWQDIVKQLTESQHTRLPVYDNDIDHIIGIIHMRDAVRLLKNPEADKSTLRASLREVYFIPENTPLNTQLLNFQRERFRMGLIVNEYGDMLGMVTMDDLLEEIVGEFTTDPSASSKDVHLQEDGTYLVDGGASLRELNRVLGWDLPTDGPKTLNGLVTEFLEHIPDQGTSLRIGDYPLEIVQTSQNTVKTVKIDPHWKERQESLAAETESTSTNR
ncbi:MAG: CNNM domain-containing protein, partial [Gammaproteobacteria bacterium]